MKTKTARLLSLLRASRMGRMVAVELGVSKRPALWTPASFRCGGGSWWHPPPLLLSSCVTQRCRLLQTATEKGSEMVPFEWECIFSPEKLENALAKTDFLLRTLTWEESHPCNSSETFQYFSPQGGKWPTGHLQGRKTFIVKWESWKKRCGS